MLRRADYLDLADTVHAALQKLTGLSSRRLTLAHAVQLSSLPPLQCGSSGSASSKGRAAAQDRSQQRGTSQPQPQQPALQRLPAAAATPPRQPSRQKPRARVQSQQPTTESIIMELVDRILTTHLPSAPAIFSDTALLSQFTLLPLALLKRWVELDKYTTDSGNTLAVLFTAWYDAQPEPPSDEQCKQLSALLPLAAVSLCFHLQALQKLPWWRPVRYAGVDAHVAHALAKQQDSNANAWWDDINDNSTITIVGLNESPTTAQHAWTLSAADLKRLWQGRSFTLPPAYFAGYLLELRLVVCEQGVKVTRVQPGLGVVGALPGPQPGGQPGAQRAAQPAVQPPAHRAAEPRPQPAGQPGAQQGAQQGTRPNTREPSWLPVLQVHPVTSWPEHLSTHIGTNATLVEKLHTKVTVVLTHTGNTAPAVPNTTTDNRLVLNRAGERVSLDDTGSRKEGEVVWKQWGVGYNPNLRPDWVVESLGALVRDGNSTMTVTCEVQL